MCEINFLGWSTLILSVAVAIIFIALAYELLRD